MADGDGKLLAAHEQFLAEVQRRRQMEAWVRERKESCVCTRTRSWLIVQQVRSVIYILIRSDFTPLHSPIATITLLPG